jgi:hypothetical protein
VLLIITSTTDVGSDYVVHRLHDRDLRFVRLNTNEYPSRFDVSLRVADGYSDLTIMHEDGSIRSEDITGVIFRRPVVPPVTEGVTEQDAAFVEREHLELLRSLWRSIPQHLWLNHPNSLWLARNKYEQLQRASSMGLHIPETLVTSNPGTIQSFGREVGWPLVAKAVKHGFDFRSEGARLAVTRKISAADLDDIESCARSPMIVQQLVHKAVDLRITVVGDNVFSAAIHSQDAPETSTDWRAVHALGGLDLEHTRHDLPEDIEEACIELARSYGLGFSAIDMAQARDGQYFFFEMNPNGEWVWIEQRLGYQICDTIIDRLLMKGRS